MFVLVQTDDAGNCMCDRMSTTYLCGAYGTRDEAERELRGHHRSMVDLAAREGWLDDERTGCYSDYACVGSTNDGCDVQFYVFDTSEG